MRFVLFMLIVLSNFAYVLFIYSFTETVVLSVVTNKAIARLHSIMKMNLLIMVYNQERIAFSQLIKHILI